jgi:adenylosuccinate lyase
LFSGVMKDLKVYPKRMIQNMESTGGILFSQRVLLALIEKGVSREKAYSIVQRNSMKSWDENKEFQELISGDVEISSMFSSNDLEDLFDYSYYIRYVDEIFNRVGLK